MLVKFIHANGKEYTLPVSQVVVLVDDGRPVAVTYEQSGVIIHCDATKSDFARVCNDLKLNPPGKVDVIK